MLSEKEINHLTKLVRIELTAEEKRQFKKQIPEILSFVSKLKKVNLIHKDNVDKNTDNYIKLLRPDEVINCSPKIIESMLKQAPLRQGNFIKIKDD